MARAEEALRQYIDDPFRFWEGHSARQAEKLARKLELWASRHGWSPVEVADRVLDAAHERSPNSPVYITGLGGSGSHWLAGMLADTGRFFYVGEVYFPPALADALDDDPEAPIIVDALHLLHHPDGLPVAGERAVNCAAGSAWIYRRIHWDPGAHSVYLIRDPRDQVLSTTFRKDEYRRFVAPDVDDRAYLEHRVQLNLTDRRHYVGGGINADVIVRYENLRADAHRELSRVLAAVGEKVEDDVVAEAVRRHDARRIAEAKEAPVGNLNLQHGLKSWADLPPEWVTAIHAELIDVIEELGYPFGPCVSAPMGDLEGRPFVGDIPPGIELRGWANNSWDPEQAEGPWLAEVRYDEPTHAAWLAEAPIEAVCAARLGRVEDRWLRSVLDNESVRILDLGTVALSSGQFALLGERGGRLSALGLWKSGPRSAIEAVRNRLPLTTVFG